MSPVPRALRPWVDELSLIDEDLVTTLGSWLPRLETALGQLGANHNHATGEPNGYDGVTRRGTYERLLTSEWLYAQEFPDEFLRRSVHGEHAYLHLAHHRPQRGRRLGVVFDAGPDQLGQPRLAHLALLFVFSRRAARRNADLLWGVCQNPASPRADVSADSLMFLLNERTASLPNEAMIDAWRENAGVPGSELWFVGGRYLCSRLDRRALGTVEITDLLQPDHPALSLLLRSGSKERALSLPLADEASCVRLLREPLRAGARSVQVAQNLSSAGGLHFSSDTRQLFCADADHRGVTMIGVPNSGRAPVAIPRRFEVPYSDEQVLGADAMGRSRYVVTLRRDEIRVFRGRRLGSRSPIASYRVPQNFQPPPPGHLCDCRIGFGAKAQDIMLVDGQRDLYRLGRGTPPTDGDTTVLVSHNVTGLRPHQNSYTYAIEVDQLIYEYHGRRADRQIRRLDLMPLPTPFVWAANRSQTGDGLFAFRSAKDAWRLERWDGGEISRQVTVHLDPSEGEVITATEDSDHASELALVVLAPALRSLEIRSETRRRVLLPLTRPTTTAAASDRGDVVAIADDEGSITLFSLVRNTTLAKLRWRQ